VAAAVESRVNSAQSKVNESLEVKTQSHQPIPVLHNMLLQVLLYRTYTTFTYITYRLCVRCAEKKEGERAAARERGAGGGSDRPAPGKG
jgi:hypothetical protein